MNNTLNIRNNPAYFTGRNGTDNNTINGISNQTFNSRNNISNNNGLTGYTLLNEDKHINKGNLFHNNVSKDLLKEQKFGFRFFVDSTYRNTFKYPDPFQFKIKLNGIEPLKNETKLELSKDIILKNPNLYGCDRNFSYFDYENGDHEIIVNTSRQLKNVLSFSLNTIIMPKFINYISCDDGTIKPIGKKLAETYKYIILNIKEINTDTKYSNTGKIRNDTFILKYDDDYGYDSTYWEAIENNVCFFESNKQNIDNLTFDFRTDKGRPLCLTLDGEKFDFMDEYRKTIDNAISLKDKVKCLKPKKKKDKVSSFTKTEIKNDNEEKINKCNELYEKLINKLISLRDIIECIYPQVHFIINNIRPQINTMTDYRT